MSTIRRMRGFSLIELMIGIALGLVILAALTTFFVNSSQTRHEIERTSRQIENGRFGIDAVRKEVHVAGFYAEIQQAGADWQMPDPCDPNLGNLGFQVTPLRLPLPITGYPEGAVMPACIADRVPGTDVLVIRRLNSEPIPVASAKAARFYVQNSRCATDSELTPWVVASGPGPWGLRQVNCAAPTDLFQYRVEIFYIRTYSANAGDNIPTLVKLELDPQPDAGFAAVNGIVTMPLVEGIQDMRLEYGIDDTGDGTPDQYRRCDATTPCTIDQWANVMTVRVNLLAVNLEPTIGYTDKKTYDMGSGDNCQGASPCRVVGPFGDMLKRHVYAAVIAAPNRVGPKEGL